MTSHPITNGPDPSATTMPRKLLALVSAIAIAIAASLAIAAPAGATAPTGDSSQLYLLTNQSRSANGRPWLGWDQNLANTAQDHANWMASTGTFAHDPNVFGEASAAVPGLSSWGENIAYVGGTGFDPIAAMHQNYMNSTGHRNNILGTQYDRVGVGIAKVGNLTYSVVRFASSGNKSALGTPVGNYDAASSPNVNRVRVTGWGIDPDSTGSVTVDVKINGALVASSPANASRTDIGNAYEGFGTNHGFGITISTIGGSTKSVCVELRNLAGFGGTVALGCKNVYVTPDLSGPFFDVSSAHPFVDEIAWLEQSGVTQGFSDGTFRPTDVVTREAMAVFLWRYLGEPAPVPNAPTFSDVPPTHPFATAIRWMAGAGITTGYSDGTFRGKDPLTRQAAATYLWSLAGKPAIPAGSPSFSDVSTSHPFVTPIRWMAGTGLSSGFPNGTFQPSGTLKRQAMAAFLFQYDAL